MRYVDEVFIYNSEDELTNYLSIEKFDIRFLGDDYKSKPITAIDLIGKILYINRDHGYSTTKIRTIIINSYIKGI